jgi:hypothetical protein
MALAGLAKNDSTGRHGGRIILGWIDIPSGGKVIWVKYTSRYEAKNEST